MGRLRLCESGQMRLLQGSNPVSSAKTVTRLAVKLLISSSIQMVFLSVRFTHGVQLPNQYRRKAGVKSCCRVHLVLTDVFPCQASPAAYPPPGYPGSGGPPQQAAYPPPGYPAAGMQQNFAAQPMYERTPGPGVAPQPPYMGR